MAETLFVSACPTAFIFSAIDGKQTKQLLWGDYVRVNGPEDRGWLPVRSRGESGWMKRSDLSTDRLLEIVFVDIGQGDGALVVPPDDKHLLVDAGEADNLYRFLRWRYNKFEKPFAFSAAVISHPDQDHYKGFSPIFADANIRFDALFHNGLVERAGADSLGPRVDGYVTDVVQTREALTNLLADPQRRGAGRYPNMLHDLLSSGRLGSAAAVSNTDRHLPGFAPGLSAAGLAIEVSPVLDQLSGAPRLPWFGNVGKTKNGHSVVLRIVYGNVSILLGGDLNIPAEHRLLQHYTGYAMPPSEADRSAVIEVARKAFRSDVAKACHHGSADFSDLFLQAVDPLVTVISSGDDEPHAHPRADALGAVGRWGRGARPLVFQPSSLVRERSSSSSPTSSENSWMRLMQPSTVRRPNPRESELRRRSTCYTSRSNAASPSMARSICVPMVVAS